MCPQYEYGPLFYDFNVINYANCTIDSLPCKCRLLRPEHCVLQDLGGQMICLIDTAFLGQPAESSAAMSVARLMALLSQASYKGREGMRKGGRGERREKEESGGRKRERREEEERGGRKRRVEGGRGERREKEERGGRRKSEGERGREVENFPFYEQYTNWQLT